MKQIIYTGTSDFREFTKLDLERLGVEHKEISFAKKQPVEVSNELADLLLNSILVEREFVLADDPIEEDEEEDDQDHEDQEEDDEDQDLDLDSSEKKPANMENPPNGDESSTADKSSEHATAKKPKAKPKASS